MLHTTTDKSLNVLFYLLLALSVCLVGFAPPDAQAAAFEWETVGDAGFSAGTAQYTDIAFDDSGTPYVVYTDGNQADRATVKKYNGSSWETVGSVGFSAGTASSTGIAIDSTGMPYVFFKNGSGLATVMRYNGTSWQVVGSQGFSDGIIYDSDIAIDGNDVPYVVYVDSSISYKLVMKKWDGATWVTVGSAGFSSANASYPAIAFDGSDAPYVIYSDSDATVEKFNGSSWVAVGNSGFANGFVQGTDIALDGNDIPHAVYLEDSTAEIGEYKATVKKYDGSWQSVGGERFSVRTGGKVGIAIDSSGTPYVAYTEDSTAQTMVSTYDAVNAVWDVVGDGGVSAGTSNHVNVAVDNSNMPHVVYMDGANGNRATVRRAVLKYSVSYDGNGSDGGNVPANALYEDNDSVTVSGNTGDLSRTGYTFAGWNTASDGSGTDYTGGDTFTMGASDVTLYAQWTVNYYDISVTVSPGEGGNASCGPDPVEHGGSSTCTASAAEGYTFTGWSGDCAGSDCVLENVTGPQSVTANFEPNSYAVTPAAGEGGSISPATAETINHGDTVDFTLTPDTGYSIGGVGGTCTGSLSGGVYTAGPIEADCRVEASFTQDPVDGLCGAADGGVLTEAPSENLCEAGNASEVTGEGPWNWSCQGIAGGADAQCSAELEHYAVATSVTPAGAGTLTCDRDPVGHGRDSVCTAGAGEHFIFERLEGDCDAIDGQNCTLTAVTSARSVVAGFLPILVGDSPNGDHPGEIQAVASGGGPGQWIFDHAESQGYIAPENAGSPPPESLEFPFGLFGFVLIDGEPGAQATVVITYPESLPADAAYWKYDPDAAEWYQLPPEHYQVSGNTVTLQLTDGGAGDHDGVADGRIVDPGGLVITQAAGEPLAVPALSRPWLLVLAALVLALGGFHFGRYRVSQGNQDTHDFPG